MPSRLSRTGPVQCSAAALIVPKAAPLQSALRGQGGSSQSFRAWQAEPLHSKDSAAPSQAAPLIAAEVRGDVEETPRTAGR